MQFIVEATESCTKRGNNKAQNDFLAMYVHADLFLVKFMVKHAQFNQLFNKF